MQKALFDLFISYSHRDAGIVHDVAGRLRVLGLRVFLDAWELELGTRLVDKLQDGIQNARSCLIFFSKHARESRWVEQECRSLTERAVSEKDFSVVPVRLDKTELPLFLRSWTWQDLSEPTESNIADFVRTLTRKFGVPEDAVVDLKNGRMWASQAELSLRLFYTLKSFGLDRKKYKQIWRISDILRRGLNFPPRVIKTCECGGLVYCGYADMGAGPHYYDSYFHICDTCYAHEYHYERSSSTTDELPRCPWCDHKWQPLPFAKRQP